MTTDSTPLYPDGGTPPEISTSTEQPSSWLPVTGGPEVTDGQIGFGLIVLGVLLLIAVAKFPLGRRRK